MAYVMRISDWSSDFCSSDLDERLPGRVEIEWRRLAAILRRGRYLRARRTGGGPVVHRVAIPAVRPPQAGERHHQVGQQHPGADHRMQVPQEVAALLAPVADRKSTSLNSSHSCAARMPSSASNNKTTHVFILLYKKHKTTMSKITP